MKKWLLIGVVGPVVLVAVLLLGGLWMIDSIARRAIEEGGTYALGVPTVLEHADVGVATGRFKMRGLNIANPRGFDSDHFMRLDHGSVAVTLGSLRRDTVELGHLRLTGLDMHLLKKGGESNYGKLLDNLKRFESKDEEETKEDTGSGKKFFIRKIELTDLMVHVDVLPIGGAATRMHIPIDSIVLTDVGSDSDQGVLMADLSGVIVKAVLASVASKAGDLIPGDIGKELTKGLAQLKGLTGVGIEVVRGAGKVVKEVAGVAKKVGEGMGKTVKGIGEGAGKAVKGVSEGAGKTVKGVGEGVGKTVKGIGGLLGGKKDPAKTKEPGAEEEKNTGSTEDP